MDARREKICFPIKKGKSDKKRWVLLFQRLGSPIILRAESFKNKGRVTGSGGHRMEEIEMKGGVIARPKLWDISKFIEEEKF